MIPVLMTLLQGRSLLAKSSGQPVSWNDRVITLFATESQMLPWEAIVMCIEVPKTRTRRNRSTFAL